MSLILLYHSVSPVVADGQLQVTPDQLFRHLDLCAGLGYEFAPLADAVAFSAERFAAVTFDDGFSSFRQAWPGLDRRGIRPTVFVCPGMVGRENAWASPGRVREPLLGPSEIRALRDEGVSFGCHGWSHRPFVGRSAGDMAGELARCEGWFREILGTRPAGFAWPFGRSDPEARRVVARVHGHALAVGPSWDADVSPLAIPRAVPRGSMGACELADELELKSFVLDPAARRPAGPPVG